MKINNSQRRLSQFWGKVDNKHIESFLPFVSGNQILDLGCGYGTTTYALSQLGLACIGIDYDQKSVEYCTKTYPKSCFQYANAEKLPFEDNFFDTIILRDALHHFYREADFEKVKNEILRVSSQNATIILFDPNVNLLLRSMRKLSFHKDKECCFEDALKISSSMNLKIKHASFNTLFSLPLSGGYVGVNFVPNIQIIQSLILIIESKLERLVNKIKLGRFFCWRYLIVCQKKED